MHVLYPHKKHTSQKPQPHLHCMHKKRSIYHEVSELEPFDTILSLLTLIRYYENISFQVVAGSQVARKHHCTIDASFT